MIDLFLIYVRDPKGNCDMYGPFTNEQQARNFVKGRLDKDGNDSIFVTKIQGRQIT